jgi:hypothetical protein
LLHAKARSREEHGTPSPSRGGLGWGWGCQESDTSGVIARSESDEAIQCFFDAHFSGLLRFARNDAFFHAEARRKKLLTTKNTKGTKKI